MTTPIDTLASLHRALGDAIDSAQRGDDPLAALFLARRRAGELDGAIGEALQANGVGAEWTRRPLPPWSAICAERERLRGVVERMAQGFQPGPDCEAVARMVVGLEQYFTDIETRNELYEIATNIGRLAGGEP